METKEVIRIGENFKIGKAIITPELLSEIESLQSDSNSLIDADRTTIADCICEILRDSAGALSQTQQFMLADLASICLKMESFRQPKETTTEI